MKKIMIVCVLSLIGMFACAVPQEGEPVPADEVTERVHVAEEVGDDLASDLASALTPAENARPGGARVCCIDWVCPTTGEEYTGCFYSTPSPGTAGSQCNAACDATCQNPYGTYCVP
ncbi:MAG TPA: hypothetical protein VK932_00160 [Kofleriaceae bacterium]|nr:hypothetical protein [Kofleriaceae bacterium]